MNSAGSASIVNSSATPRVSGPAKDDTFPSTESRTQLCGMTGVTVSNTTRSDAAGNRLRSQSVASRSDTGADEFTAARVSATFALNRSSAVGSNFTAASAPSCDGGCHSCGCSRAVR